MTAHASGSHSENEPGIESWSHTVGRLPRSCCTPKGLVAYPADCGTGDSFTKEALDSYVNREHPEDSIIYPKVCPLIFKTFPLYRFIFEQGCAFFIGL